MDKEFFEAMDLEIADYRDTGIHYSTLSRFYKSPDHVMLPQKRTWACLIGIAAEQFLHSLLTGNSDFFKDFFESSADGSGADMNLVEIIKTKGELKSLEKLNKDGSRSKSSKRLHQMIDECAGHPGKIPVPKGDMGMIRAMCENLLKLRVDSDLGGIPVTDFLARSEWQKEFYRGDLAALPDYCYQGYGYALLFDIKTCASFQHFERFMRQSYWIQEQHYIRCVPNAESMIFLALSKEPPFLARLFTTDPESRIRLSERYDNLIARYRRWVDGGMEPAGYMPAKTVKVY
jgi:hypothetical protein